MNYSALLHRYLSLQLGGEGAAAAETYKSRRVGGPERRVYIVGNSDYVAGECTVCKLQIVSKNDIFTTGDGGYILYIVQGFFL